MICPYCGSRLSKRERCDRCGEDVSKFKKLYMAANKYYNNGLMKAKIRDLSGAIVDLKNALKIDKKHTDARNLLGLIYLEMGETVSALSEFVISKHFQPENPVADYYMNLVQETPTNLDSLNQIIKRYNGALAYAKQGSDDLAIIQLKKVISMNPHYVQALLLLALLYIHAEDYDRARKVISKVLKVDVTNTSALEYLDYIKLTTGVDTKTASSPSSSGSAIAKTSVKENDVITPISAYSEEKPNVIAWVNLVIGIIVGAAFILVALVPGIKKNAVSEQRTEIVALGEKIQKLEAEVAEKDNEYASLKQDYDEAKYKLDNPEVPEEDQQVQEEPSQYESLMQAASYFLMDKKDKAADRLIEVDTEKLELPEAVTLYNKLASELFAEQADKVYEEGHKLYSDGKYEEALEVFEKVLKMNPEQLSAIYFTGRAYHRLEKYDMAVEYYNKLINEYPDSGRAGEAKERMAELKADGKID